MSLLAAALAVAAAGGRSERFEPPTALDAAGAYSEWSGEPCRKLIDQCDFYVDPTGAEPVRDLACRRAGRALAGCRFTVVRPAGPPVRCKALLRREMGDDGPEWLAMRSPRGGAPKALDVRCRERRGGE
jgi:hypothetical protein